MPGRLTSMRPLVPLAVLAASFLLVAGCGTIASGGDVIAEPPTGSATPGAATELTIVVKAGPGNAEDTYTLVCDPPGGDHPDPEAACRLLNELKDPFAPVPSDAMCTQVYGGPQTATVTGTLRADPVDAQFSRTDGCQIARWDKHVTLLVESGGVEEFEPLKPDESPDQ
jgi:predicted small secreted protein